MLCAFSVRVLQDQDAGGTPHQLAARCLDETHPKLKGEKRRFPHFALDSWVGRDSHFASLLVVTVKKVLGQPRSNMLE